MLQTSSAYGIILIERGEASIAILRGTYWEVVKSVEFFVPGKHSAGGQSAVRFKRQTEHLAEVFYKMVAEEANKVFLNIPELKGIVIAGPGPTKDEFLKSDFLDYRLRQKIIAVVDVGYVDEYGVRETIKKAWKYIQDNEYVRAKMLMEEFMHHLVKNSEYVIYGKEKVERAIKSGIAKVVLLSEELDEDEILNFMLEGEKRGIKVEIIPKAIEENKMLKETFTGYAAILRAPAYLISEEIEKIDYE